MSLDIGSPVASVIVARPYLEKIMDLKKLRRFMPVVGRNNQQDREGWLERTLAAIPEKSRILDAGAGTRRYRRYCCHLEYVSQDFGQYDGEGDGVGLHSGEFDYGELDIVSDICDIPEENGSFDAIMCIEVLEHVPNPAEAIKEFGRLLKVGGLLVLTAPFCSLTHLAPYHFCTGFSEYWFRHQLGESGFDILDIQPNGNYFEYLAQELYRLPTVATRYSKTKPKLWELAGMFMVQSMLARLSRRDQGASELLCYGFHSLAVKR